MKNVTIPKDEAVSRWPRIRAEELKNRLSGVVGQMLKEEMLVDQSYEKAGYLYLAQPTRALKKAWIPVQKRRGNDALWGKLCTFHKPVVYFCAGGRWIVFFYTFQKMDRL